MGSIPAETTKSPYSPVIQVCTGFFYWTYFYIELRKMRSCCYIYSMKITNKEVLDAFMDKHADTRNPLNKWMEVMENSEFKNHNDLKSVFPSADYVGNRRYVFNIKGNRYRLVVMVVFIGGRMQIRFCGTHADYDKIKDIENI